MVLDHCSKCDVRHLAPLDEGCPFPTCEQPAPRRTTRRTRRSPSLSPPPPPKRGRGRPRGKAKGSKALPQRHQSPEASDATQDQPDSPHSPACPAPRDSGMQPPCAPQPVDPQVAAIQAIADQLTRMQQEAKAYQAAEARDREADCQDMLRRTAAAQPAPGPSHPDLALTRPPYPPANSGHELRRTTAAQPAPGPSPGTGNFQPPLGPQPHSRLLPRPKDMPPRLPPTPETALLQQQPQHSPPDLQAQTSCRTGPASPMQPGLHRPTSGPAYLRRQGSIRPTKGIGQDSAGGAFFWFQAGVTLVHITTTACGLPSCRPVAPPPRLHLTFYGLCLEGTATKNSSGEQPFFT